MMTATITEILPNPVFGILAFLVVLLFIALINAVFMDRLDRYPKHPPLKAPENLPRLSVLVPARNEAENIASCVGSLLSQDYTNYEVIVLNDHSTDPTGAILAELAGSNLQLRVLEGQPLPEGWLGKNWACHQLSEAAQGDLLLFIDADTTHHPQTLRRSVTALLEENAGMLTALPRQQVITWGERMVVPVIYFSLLSFLPLPLAHQLRLPVFSAALGQFMLFTRPAYDQIGGYAAVRSHGTDDIALARLVTAHNLPWRMADGGMQVSTRMYRNFRQSFEGLSKNLFAAFDYRILPFLFAWLWMGYLFWRPFIELGASLTGIQNSQLDSFFAVLSILGSLALWCLVTWRMRFPRLLFLLYPFIILLTVLIALRSVYLSLRGRASWKGRSLSKATVRWI
jgi:chlorobactene glucosyltransferase